MNIDRAKLLENLNSIADMFYEKGDIKTSGLFVILRDDIESGTFDSEPAEHEKAYWAREGLIKKQQTELNHYKTALRKIVCLNIPMPDEVFNIANDALEEDQ